MHHNQYDAAFGADGSSRFSIVAVKSSLSNVGFIDFSDVIVTRAGPREAPIQRMGLVKFHVDDSESMLFGLLEACNRCTHKFFMSPVF